MSVGTALTGPFLFIFYGMKLKMFYALGSLEWQRYPNEPVRNIETIDQQ